MDGKWNNLLCYTVVTWKCEFLHVYVRQGKPYSNRACTLFSRLTLAQINVREKSSTPFPVSVTSQNRLFFALLR